MANLFGRTRPLNEARSVPQGDTVGSFTSYLDAQKAVDYLADQNFPVQMVSIVGNDLKMVERVTGKLSYPRVALSSGLTGAWFGLFVGLLLSFFEPPSGAGGGLPSIVTSILLGAAFWILFGIATYAMQRGKRDFTSTSQVLASGYDVIVATESSAEARRLLAQLPMTAASAHAAPYAGQQNRPAAPQLPTSSPQRPNGWTDPYPHGTGTGSTKPGEPAGPDEAPVEGAVVPESGTTPGTYRDLPDGRPQYGIRLPQEPDAAPTQAAAAQDAAEGPRPTAPKDQPSQELLPQEPPSQGSHATGQPTGEPDAVDRPVQAPEEQHHR
ncbi:ECF transporter S component [Paenarthrobacter sp. Z7-10]|uniref:general stress protein n=1 Tax=Paenarthrobacter sp. Z7-10 TaxID=2787635 RepID=UPI0022A99085|nr:general stress protein [Paenarthrobacter sp. Z7-10]MCZ2404014.1 ECF transporter S component [Paenarthrobacter sp. Z7-10]